jgi:hypothetical protein
VWSYGVTMCETFNYGEEPKLANLGDCVVEGQEQQKLLHALQTGARLVQFLSNFTNMEICNVAVGFLVLQCAHKPCTSA